MVRCKVFVIEQPLSQPVMTAHTHGVYNQTAINSCEAISDSGMAYNHGIYNQTAIKTMSDSGMAYTQGIHNQTAIKTMSDSGMAY